MSIEEKLKSLILQKFKSVRIFSQTIGVPNSTIATILTKGILNASVTTMIQISRELKIDLDRLVDGEIVDISNKAISSFTQSEIEHIKKYRTLDEGGKQTVDAVLQIQYDIAVARQESTGLTAENERELEAYKQELLAAQKGQTSAALENIEKAAII